jgi:YesN/AraC family two-component response regulator
MADRRLTFVIAEDEDRMRDYLARKIPDLDHNLECVATAADGEEAVEMVEQHLPDLLITDIKMPVLGGLELVERIRRTNPDLRILIVSGYSEFEYARRAIELGVDDYLLKPIDVENLRETLRRIRIRLEASAGSVDAEFGLDRMGAREADLAKAVQVYLQENYRQPYSLERLAASFGCKAAYLLRLYRKITGSTPTQDLIRLRIEKAKRLLVGHRPLEIKQVAYAVGYEDALYFSRLFKKETGQSPSAFRDSMGRP